MRVIWIEHFVLKNIHKADTGVHETEWIISKNRPPRRAWEPEWLDYFHLEKDQSVKSAVRAAKRKWKKEQKRNA